MSISITRLNDQKEFNIPTTQPSDFFTKHDIPTFSISFRQNIPKLATTKFMASNKFHDWHNIFHNMFELQIFCIKYILVDNAVNFHVKFVIFCPVLF
jgi:hypothetical protein